MPSLTLSSSEERAIAYVPGKVVVYLDPDGTGTSQVSAPAGSQFRVLPKPEMNAREVIYIAGRSGCGKSYWAREYAVAYKKLFPGRPIYLFSNLKSDETLDKIRPTRIKLETLLEEPIQLPELKNSLCIFDDYDATPQPQKREVVRLIDEIASQGRHHNITLIVVSHHLTNYKETRLILNESTLFVVYPDGAGATALENLLGRYAGVEKKILNALRAWNSRWLCFSVKFPAYVVGETRVALLR